VYSHITILEKARVLGARAQQLSQGATVNLQSWNGLTDPLEIAELELKQRKIDMKIRRHLPDQSYEIWHVSELELDDDED